MKLRSKLLLTISVATSLPVLILGTLGYLRSRDKLEQSALDHLRLVSGYTYNAIQGNLNRLTMRTNEFASDREVVSALKVSLANPKAVKPTTIQSFLSEHLVQTKLYLDQYLMIVDVVDLSGRIVASTDPNRHEMRFEETSFMEIDPPLTLIGEINRQWVEQGSTQNWVDQFSIASPVFERNGQNHLGWVVNHFDAKVFERNVAGQDIPGAERQVLAVNVDSLESYLVNQDGEVVLGNLVNRESETVEVNTDTQGVRACLDGGQSTSGRWLNPRGEPVIGSAECFEFGGFRWAFLTEQDEKVAIANIDREVSNIIVGALASLAVALVVAAYLAESFTLRIVRLKKLAENFSKGLRNTKDEDWVSPDEIGELSDAFHQMANQVDERTQALEKANNDIQAAMRVKQDFLATVSHDIRTPLNAIIGTADLLRSVKSDAERDKYLEIQSRASENLLILVNDILDYSKMESGQLQIEMIPFNLEEVLQSSLEIVSEKAKSKGLGLNLRYPADTVFQPVARHWKGDPNRISQIVLNLIGNAVKFTASGSVELIVEPFRAGNLVHFYVKDSGIGISKDKQETIFEAFSQADASIARKFGGSGLGLSICKKLAILMGGRVWVQSELGKGSEFHVELKLEPSNKLQPKPKAKAEVYTFDFPLTILLVEDDADSRFLIQAYLKDTPHRLTIAENGFEGVEKYSQASGFDVVCLDTQMPVMNGYEAAAAIRAHEKEKGWVPSTIISMSANSFTTDIRQALDAGANTYLSKPVKRRALLEKLAELKPRNVGIEKRATDLDAEKSTVVIALKRAA